MKIKLDFISFSDRTNWNWRSNISKCPLDQSVNGNAIFTFPNFVLRCEIQFLNRKYLLTCGEILVNWRLFIQIESVIDVISIPTVLAVSKASDYFDSNLHRGKRRPCNSTSLFWTVTTWDQIKRTCHNNYNAIISTENNSHKIHKCAHPSMDGVQPIVDNAIHLNKSFTHYIFPHRHSVSHISRSHRTHDELARSQFKRQPSIGPQFQILSHRWLA